MKVIPEPSPGTASVLVFEKKGRYSMMKGEGDDNNLCGNCRNMISDNIPKGMAIKNIVFGCPNCDAINTAA
ncbi:MAG: hypothetical protein LUO89_02090 [Methanothrix sp.]|nr:hypothetical protein [Methanothrix sp.]